MCRGISGRIEMRTRLLVVLFAFAAIPAPLARQPSPGAGPIIVLETEKGVIEFETYPEEAPKTVAQIVGLVKRNFYNGQRFHRAEMGLIQIGDPQSKNVLMRDWWGRGGSDKIVGVAEITKKRRHVRGAVGLAYSGNDPKSGSSQFYITTRPHPDLDAKYTVFGRVTKGLEVVDKIKVADVLKKAYVKDGAAKS
jgi:cyclophilin family peptidyl-prolyl cis-trans isomerase